MIEILRMQNQNDTFLFKSKRGENQGRGPRGAQEASKTPQERPKSVPRAAKIAPKPPKSARKAAKSDPRVTEICPRGAQCASRGTFFVLFFVFFCFVAFYLFLAVCCIFLRLLSFFASLRVHVTRHRIWGGASNRGLPLTCGLDPSQS